MRDCLAHSDGAPALFGLCFNQRRRFVTCSLTDRGRKLITKTRRHWEKRWREALAEFSSEELATTAALLERLRAMYEQLD